VALVKAPTFQTVVRNGVAVFHVTVRNTGNVILHNVRVADPRAPGCVRRFASLAAGESRSYRCSLAGVRVGFRHLAHVSGLSPAGARVLASALGSVEVRVVRRIHVELPSVLIIKDPDLQTVARGQPAPFHVIVQNTGNVALHDVRVTDVPTPYCNRTIGTLAVGQKATYDCRSVPLFRTFANRAIVHAVSPHGVPVSLRDFVVVVVKGTTTAPPSPVTTLPFTG